VGRFGASILHALGLDDWITRDIDQYIARAVGAAADLVSLAQLRAALRPRFAASPLRDPVGLAREVEAAYRGLWQAWCDGDGPGMRRLVATGDFDGARRLAETALAVDPDDVSALHALGLVRFGQGDAAAGIALLQRSIAIRQEVDVLSDLGVMLRTQGRPAEAEAAYREALRIDPSSVHALGNLGNILLDQHRAGEAETALGEALRHGPFQPWLLRSMALSILARGGTDRAEALLRQALAIDTADPEAHETLAALLGRSGHPIEAEAHHRAAMPRLHQRHRALSNLAIVLQTQGRYAEAEQCCREGLVGNPDYAAAHCNLLYSLNYRPDLTAEAIFGEYREWDRVHAAQLLFAAPQFSISRIANRRLRIGYVSADFRRHSVAWFAEPLLAAHDRGSVELFCYADVAAPDAVTARFRRLADQWRDIAGVDDAAAAEMIRADNIDVLVDLTGHTAGSRLSVFARKPAPVQVAYLLGHGYTSGLRAMDAFLADDFLAPPGADALFSETIVRLPRIPLAYAPPCEMPPVAPLPASTNGYVTFGHFGRPDRLNDTVIAAWARILHAVPDARLVLNSLPFREPAFRDLFTTRFGAHDIVADRLELLATAPQSRTWAAYGTIDIALDPFPHNAGTTTIEALWHGVPVVSLAGRPSVGRFGAMILHAVGMDGWVTSNVDEYVARAVAAAADTAALARERSELRQRIAASPLCDAPGLARHVETAYRDLWNAWARSC
jgi:predicted O-linked N-acetylglucosamine transferase (SPINDLY family)